ncbi:MAG: Fur family transcriptional regulator [Acidimicrobiia bacterium]
MADRLAEFEVRYTKGRRRVVHALTGASGPMSAAELHRGLGRRVPLSSLYRTLSVLGEAGVLERFHDPDGFTNYELAEWLSGHHHHLVCVECGLTEDLELSPALERSLGVIVKAAATKRGFEIAGHRLDLEARCEACRIA